MNIRPRFYRGVRDSSIDLLSHLSLELDDQDYDDLSLALEPVFAAMKPLRAVGHTQGHGRGSATTSAC